MTGRDVIIMDKLLSTGTFTPNQQELFVLGSTLAGTKILLRSQS